MFKHNLTVLSLFSSSNFFNGDLWCISSMFFLVSSSAFINMFRETITAECQIIIFIVVSLLSDFRNSLAPLYAFQPMGQIVIFTFRGLKQYTILRLWWYLYKGSYTSCHFNFYQTSFFSLFLAFDFCQFCVITRFFHPRHNGHNTLRYNTRIHSLY